MYPSRAYPVLINMKQVGVSLPLPLPLPGWNASLQKKWRSLNSPQKRTEEQPNSRKTEQWHREGKVEEGGLVEREEWERKERRGFLVRMSLKSCGEYILRSFLQVYGDYLLSVGNSHFSIRAWTSVCIRAEVKI